MNTCGLCLQPRELKESHILPAFVIRWLKETSGTGFIRFGREPNRRVQDGMKSRLLCGGCEQQLAKCERSFAENLFRPLTVENHSPFYPRRYGEWMALFAASVSWRTLLALKEMEALERLSLSRKDLDSVPRALEKWRQFIHGDNGSPGLHELHFISLGLIERLAGPAFSRIPPNINQYFARFTDIDIVHGHNQLFVFTKMGPAVVLGFITPPPGDWWVGSHIDPRGATFKGKFTLREPFWKYLLNRSAHLREVQQSISKKQWKKIDESYRRNPSRALASGTLRAIAADVEMFGSDAVFFS